MITWAGSSKNGSGKMSYKDRLTRYAALVFFIIISIWALIANISYNPTDPSWNVATEGRIENVLGAPGAIIADFMHQFFGFNAIVYSLFMFGVSLYALLKGPENIERGKPRLIISIIGLVLLNIFLSSLRPLEAWSLASNMGGILGDLLLNLLTFLFKFANWAKVFFGILSLFGFLACAYIALGMRLNTVDRIADMPGYLWASFLVFLDDLPFNRANPNQIKFNDRIKNVSGRPKANKAPQENIAPQNPQPAKEAPVESPINNASEAMQATAPAAATNDINNENIAPTSNIDAATYQEPQNNQEAHNNVQTEPTTNLEATPPNAPSDVQEIIEKTPNVSPYDAISKHYDKEFNLAHNIPEPEEAAEIKQEEIKEAPKETPKEVHIEISNRMPQPIESKMQFDDGDDDFQLPSINLLANAPKDRKTHDEDALRLNAQLLMSVLEQYKVNGEIINVRPGPVVTLYELEPEAGIKGQRVINLADDIARSMSAISCRVAVVKGRNAIGIELPNSHRESVYLRTILSSEDYADKNIQLPMALGETIGGEPYIVDLAKMPHLLIAGTTGSGKSVGINAMILSLLYRLKPKECRFIMIDPKMVELSIYNDIPHLLTPVVIDPKKAVSALKWAVAEMENRYNLMSKLGVRNIASYNEKAKEAKRTGEVFEFNEKVGFDKETGRIIYDKRELKLDHMPFIVIVIDEMADLMMIAGKEIEGLIQRLAQMARAVGIHLITATQRPSVDVITGTIKANFPTRISYMVTSKIDSRTILGEGGAEQLLGQGDLLFMANGGRINRLHGPFVSDKEVSQIVAALKAQGEPEYFDDITSSMENEGEVNPTLAQSSGDELFDKAVEIVARDRKVSTSYIQRQLRIGYNRAADLVDRMEREGMVSAPDHVGRRKILLPDHNE